VHHPQPGKLFLIGAGPGDPELLTLKAARVLAKCDVVLYDRLVSKEVLRHAPTDAECIYVGKHRGEQGKTQEQIFELIRDRALAGKTVARLKGGDPLIFGRGGEEWLSAVEHGIEVELIPGVSAAIAAPGLAGIPLTFRGISQGAVIVTGHCHQGQAGEWERYANADTVVVLMGVQNREHIAASLIAAGRRADEPVAFIMRGSMKGELTIEATLAAVAAGTVEVQSPAVFIVGEVVRLRPRLIGQAQSRPAPTRSAGP
jgi:uroporphyrin-III C-methyltransferase